MNESFLEKKEMDTLEKLLSHSAEDTISCWIATRLNGHSASVACYGNISFKLLSALDELVLPHLRSLKLELDKLNTKEG